MDLLYTIVAFLPFTLLLFLMVILKKPAFISLPTVLVITVFLSYVIWGMEPLWYLVSLVRGGLVTIDILLIIFGVVLLFQVLKLGNSFEKFNEAIETISSDRRVQAIIIGWFFVSLIEGAAGFGTPAMIAAPLLVSIGFRPLLAVIITLMGDGIAVAFGAVGVPITIGITQGLPQNVDNVSGLIHSITMTSSLFIILIGSFMPLAISAFVTKLGSGSIREGLSLWKFSLLSGIMLTIPIYLTALLLGPEFPAIVASLIGLLLILYLAKEQILLPRIPYRFSHDEPIRSLQTKPSFFTFFRPLSPYILLVILLGLSRIPYFPFQEKLSSLAIYFPEILGTDISHTITPFYSPGFFLILLTIFMLVVIKPAKKDLANVLPEVFKKIVTPFLALLSTLTLVNVLLYSGNNTTGLPSILLFIVELLSSVSILWPFFAPFVGMVGTFVTGSTTVSNLLFSTVQYETARLHGLSPSLILSLQLIGGALGNLIAIHNIVAVIAVVGLHHKEGHVLSRTIVPAVIFTSVLGLVGMIAAYLLH